MGLATLITGRDTGPEIGGVRVDVSVTETHRQSAQVTESPIELGSDIADHRRRLPDELDMEGILSDIPTTLADKIALETGEDADKNARYLILLDLFNFAEVMEVVTGIRLYENMVFTRLEVTRNQSTGKIIRFSASMRELEFAQSETTAAQPSAEVEPKAKPKTDVGPKPPTPASPAAAAGGSRSLLSFAGGAAPL